MNNFLRGFGNFKKNENGIMEYVDYLGTKYTYDPTIKKWKSNGRILNEAMLQDEVLSEQEGVGDAADDSGGGRRSTAQQSQQLDLILLFDAIPGQLLWSEIQESSFGNQFNDQNYQVNSAFYEAGTAPNGFSVGSANEGWRKKIPEYFYDYISIPKPLTTVNLGKVIYFPRFYSEAISTTAPNSVNLPSGYTGGYYRIGTTVAPGFATISGDELAFPLSTPEAYTINGVQNFSNFDSTGRSVGLESIDDNNVLYYYGLTGPIPAGGESIIGFNSTTNWPTRNERSVIPVHDVVNFITFIVSSIRAFYKNNPEYPQPNFNNELTIDHYILLTFGYSNPSSLIIDAIDLYANMAPNYYSASTNPSSILSGVNGNIINRYDAITGVNEINRILRCFKNINDGSQRSNEIKNAVLNIIENDILPDYGTSDPASITEYEEIETILNNLHKFKISFYYTVPGVLNPAYLTTCSNGFLNVNMATGSGADCLTSTIDGVESFYSLVPNTSNGTTYPFFEENSIFSLYTSNTINLNLNNELQISIPPYESRGPCPDFSTYVDIINSKYSRAFILSNNTNGLLTNVDWVHFLAEDSEIHSNDLERISFNYYSTTVTKKIINYYRTDNIPIIAFTIPLTVISSGNVKDLASNGAVLITPDLIKRRVINPCYDAGIDGFGVQQAFDPYTILFLRNLDLMTFNYSNSNIPDLSSGQRFFANSSLSAYYGKNINIGEYIASPGYDIRFLSSGSPDSNNAISNISGTTYSLNLSSGDTATTNWSSLFATERGLTPGEYFSFIRGTCYEHIFDDTDSRFENNVSRRTEVQNIIEINTQWLKTYFENSLLLRYGLTS